MTHFDLLLTLALRPTLLAPSPTSILTIASSLTEPLFCSPSCKWSGEAGIVFITKGQVDPSQWIKWHWSASKQGVLGCPKKCLLKGIWGQSSAKPYWGICDPWMRELLQPGPAQPGHLDNTLRMEKNGSLVTMLRHSDLLLTERSNVLINQDTFP